VHKVLLERNAEKDLDRIPPNIRSRIISALQSLAQNPRPRGCRKLADGVNDWRIRVGQYRVLYELDDRNKLVSVNRVRHRRDVYR
jgi:mRNA interferase RelE/StbE